MRDYKLIFLAFIKINKIMEIKKYFEEVQIKSK